MGELQIPECPPEWRKLLPFELNGKEIAEVFTHWILNLRVLRSVAKTKDGDLWLHVSVSHPNALPTWHDLVKVKNTFIGRDVEAYQVLAAEKDHVNCHPYCLHLFASMDGKRRVANLQDIVDERVP